MVPAKMKFVITSVAFVIILCLCVTESEQASSSSNKGKKHGKNKLPYERPTEEREEYVSPGTESHTISRQRRNWFPQAYPPEHLKPFYDRQRGEKSGRLIEFEYPSPKVPHESLPKYATQRSAILAKGLLRKSADEARKAYFAHSTLNTFHEAHITRARYQYAIDEEARFKAVEKDRKAEKKQSGHVPHKKT